MDAPVHGFSWFLGRPAAPPSRSGPGGRVRRSVLHLVLAQEIGDQPQQVVRALDVQPVARSRPRHQFEARRLKEQGYELQAVTSDSDKDGNEYVITITLSANSQAALKAAEPAYRAILEKY